MSKSRPDIPAAPPSRHVFDPWNSVGAGHQRDGNNRLAGSVSWRQSRSAKLSAQFRGGRGGGCQVADSVGAESMHFGADGRKADGGFERGASALRRESGCRSVLDMLTRTGAGVTKPGPRKTAQKADQAYGPPARKIFDGLCFYINGSTAPTMSDHRLKCLLVENGGRVAVALGRRSVTHVIIGTSNGPSGQAGAGGSLAAAKIQKEVQRVGGCSVHYVRVEWVLESLKVGKRLGETAFVGPKLAPPGLKSIYSIFKKASAGETDSQSNLTEPLGES